VNLQDLISKVSKRCNTKEKIEYVLTQLSDYPAFEKESLRFKSGDAWGFWSAFFDNVDNTTTKDAAGIFKTLAGLIPGLRELLTDISKVFTSIAPDDETPYLADLLINYGIGDKPLQGLINQDVDNQDTTEGTRTVLYSPKKRASAEKIIIDELYDKFPSRKNFIELAEQLGFPANTLRRGTTDIQEIHSRFYTILKQKSENERTDIFKSLSEKCPESKIFADLSSKKKKEKTKKKSSRKRKKYSKQQEKKSGNEKQPTLKIPNSEAINRVKWLLTNKTADHLDGDSFKDQDNLPALLVLLSVAEWKRSHEANKESFELAKSLLELQKNLTEIKKGSNDQDARESAYELRISINAVQEVFVEKKPCGLSIPRKGNKGKKPWEKRLCVFLKNRVHGIDAEQFINDLKSLHTMADSTPIITDTDYFHELEEPQNLEQNPPSSSKQTEIKNLKPKQKIEQYDHSNTSPLSKNISKEVTSELAPERLINKMKANVDIILSEIQQTTLDGSNKSFVAFEDAFETFRYSKSPIEEHIAVAINRLPQNRNPNDRRHKIWQRP